MIGSEIGGKRGRVWNKEERANLTSTSDENACLMLY
jgi:hypothetical protein